MLEKKGVRRAAVFGSVAKGQSTSKSDIDLVVDFEGSKTLLDLVDLKLRLEEVLKKRVDLVTYRSLSPLLKEIILKEQIIIYEKRS